MEQAKNTKLHKLHTGPFTGVELSDGFTDELYEEMALDDEACEMSDCLNEYGELDHPPVNRFE